MNAASTGGTWRVLLGVDRFPQVSQTFVLRLAADLTAAGGDVRLAAHKPSPDALLQPEVASAGLAGRAAWLPVPTSWAPAFRFLPPGAFFRAPALAAFRHRAERRLTPEELARQLPRAQGRRALGRFDILHAQFANCGLWMDALRRGGWIRGPLVVSVRGRDFFAGRQQPETAERFDALFQRAAHFLPVSDDLAQALRMAGCPEDKITVFPSPVLLERFPFHDPATKASTSETPIRFLMVGRLVEKKGFDVALRALARWKSGQPETAWTVEIVGEGPEADALHHTAGELGLDAHIRWTSPVDHQAVAQKMAAADLLIAPSRTARDGDAEGTPNVVKEAMASGLPVLATRHGGIPELLDGGGCGFLVAENDPLALAAGLTDALNRRGEWPERARRARQRVEGHYASGPALERLLDLYGRLGAPVRRPDSSKTLRNTSH